MTMETINSQLVTEFSAAVHVQAQQTITRLMPYVTVKKMEGDVWAYDSIGQLEAREINARHQRVEPGDIQFTRRKMSRKRFEVTVYIDKHDVAGMIRDPQGELAAAVLRAINRRRDRTIMEAMFATVPIATVGCDFSSTKTFAQDGGLTVNATAGLTYLKLLEIIQNFMDNEVGTEAPIETYLTISGDEHTKLMTEAALTSGDFTRNLVIDQGRIARAAGMNLIAFGGSVANPMIAVNSGVRDCAAFARGAICLGISKEFDIKIEPRADLYDTVQIVSTGYIGAVRTEGVLVQKVQTTS